MTVGIAAVLANAWLDTLSNTSAAFAAIYVKLHTGDPGSAGTANASAETTRKLAAFNAASAGSKALTSTLSWTSWAAGTETITHVSIWSASTSGTFYGSGALGSSKTVNNGDTFNLTALTASLTPLAA